MAKGKAMDLISESSLRRAELGIRMHTAKLEKALTLDQSIPLNAQTVEDARRKIAMYTAAAEARKA